MNTCPKYPNCRMNCNPAGNCLLTCLLEKDKTADYGLLKKYPDPLELNLDTLFKITRYKDHTRRHRRKITNYTKRKKKRR